MTITPENLVSVQNWRYATKLFQNGKMIPEKTWTAIEESLLASPSSYGLQPWKFIVVTDPALKKALRPHTWNQSQTEDCSHYLVICAKEKMDESHVKKFVDRMVEVRGGARENLAGYEKMMISDLVTGPRSQVSFEWAARQCYIALGNFMTSCALLGVDTCPIEGFVPAEYDKILGLVGTGYKSVVCCAAGYRGTDDKYAQAKKVRFAANDLVIHR
jgi:nitroreductase